MGPGGDVVNVHIVGDRCLAELCLEDTGARGFIREWDVYECVEAAGTAEGVVELFGTIGGANHEHVLLGGHAVHFYWDVSIVIGWRMWKVIPVRS